MVAETSTQLQGLEAIERTAISYLNVKTDAEQIDRNYLEYIGKLLTRFFAEQKIFDYNVQAAILQNVPRKHIWDKINKGCPYTVDMLLRIQEYNDNIRGKITIRSKWIPFIKYTYSLDRSESNTKPYVLVGISMVVAFVGGTYLISKACSLLTNSSTI